MAERFGVVVAIGLTFFGLMLIASEDIGLSIGGGDQKQEVVMFSESFGEMGGATSDTRTIKFGTFNIGEGRGEIQAYQANKVDLKNSLLSGNSVSFDYNATQPTEAEVSFEVLGKEGSGAMYVEVNGKRIFEEQLVTTATETVKIDSSDLKPGINTFKIGVNKGGLLGSTHYAIEDLEVTVNDRKFNDHKDNFQLYQYELKDFVTANLTFNIPVDSSVLASPLRIKVNGNTVFETPTVRSEQTVEIPRREAELHPGYNSITFETDAEAKYKIENAQLTVRYIGITEQAEKRRSFRLSEEELSFVEREDTDETLSFDYQVLSGDNNLYVEVGNYNKTVNPANGENTVEIPEESFKEENELIIRGSGSFVLNNVKVKSEVVEE